MANFAQRLQYVARLARLPPPSHVESFCGDIHSGALHTRHARQSALDQPHASRAQDAINRKRRLACLCIGLELTGNFFRVVQLELRRNQAVLPSAGGKFSAGAVIIAEAVIDDALCDCLATGTAHRAHDVIYGDLPAFASGDWQSAMKAGSRCVA